jgi:hypothetical protein
MIDHLAMGSSSEAAHAAIEADVHGSRAPAPAFDDLHPSRRFSPLLTRTCRPEQQGPAPLILGGQLQPSQHDVVGRSDPSQYSGTRPGAHDLLDRPQATPVARRGMNHEQAIDVDPVLLQSRGIRHERWGDPSDPLSGLGRIDARQCLQGRHQQGDLPYAVTVDEYFDEGAERPTAAG